MKPRRSRMADVPGDTTAEAATLDPIARAQARILKLSAGWHVAAGWSVVLILLWRFILYGVVNYLLQRAGMPAMAPLESMSIGDFGVLAAIPLVGVFGASQQKS
jgi:hypothetical protein